MSTAKSKSGGGFFAAFTRFCCAGARRYAAVTPEQRIDLEAALESRDRKLRMPEPIDIFEQLTVAPSSSWIRSFRAFNYRLVSNPGLQAMLARHGVAWKRALFAFATTNLASEADVRVTTTSGRTRFRSEVLRQAVTTLTQIDAAMLSSSADPEDPRLQDSFEVLDRLEEAGIANNQSLKRRLLFGLVTSATRDCFANGSFAKPKGTFSRAFHTASWSNLDRSLSQVFYFVFSRPDPAKGEHSDCEFRLAVRPGSRHFRDERLAHAVNALFETKSLVLMLSDDWVKSAIDREARSRVERATATRVSDSLLSLREIFSRLCAMFAILNKERTVSHRSKGRSKRSLARSAADPNSSLNNEFDALASAVAERLSIPQRRAESAIEASLRAYERCASNSPPSRIVSFSATLGRSDVEASMVPPPPTRRDYETKTDPNRTRSKPWPQRSARASSGEQEGSSRGSYSVDGTGLRQSDDGCVHDRAADPSSPKTQSTAEHADRGLEDSISGGSVELADDSLLKQHASPRDESKPYNRASETDPSNHTISTTLPDTPTGRAARQRANSGRMVARYSLGGGGFAGAGLRAYMAVRKSITEQGNGRSDDEDEAQGDADTFGNFKKSSDKVSPRAASEEQKMAIWGEDHSITVRGVSPDSSATAQAHALAMAEAAARGRGHYAV